MSTLTITEQIALFGRTVALRRREVYVGGHTTDTRSFRGKLMEHLVEQEKIHIKDWDGQHWWIPIDRITEIAEIPKFKK